MFIAEESEVAPFFKIRSLLYSRGKKGFVSFLGLLLSIGIILVLCYITLNAYLRKPSFDKATGQSFQEHDIDVSSQQAVLQSTKTKIKDVEKQLLEREQQLLKHMP